MVDHHDQHMFVCVQSQQAADDGDVPVELECVAADAANRVIKLLGMAGLKMQTQASLLDGKHSLRGDGRCFLEKGAQAFMSLDQIGQRQFQCVSVQLAAQSYRKWHVIRSTGAFQAMQEPQAVLCVRKRQCVRSGHRTQRGASLLCVVQSLCQRGDGWRLEYVAYGQFGAKARADLADQARGEQRVTPQVEEAVIDADERKPEYRAENAGDDVFLRAAWCASAMGGEFRWRQQALVELAIGREWQAVEHDDGAGHHIVG